MHFILHPARRRYPRLKIPVRFSWLVRSVGVGDIGRGFVARGAAISAGRPPERGLGGGRCGLCCAKRYRPSDVFDFSRPGRRAPAVSAGPSDPLEVGLRVDRTYRQAALKLVPVPVCPARPWRHAAWRQDQDLAVPLGREGGRCGLPPRLAKRGITTTTCCADWLTAPSALSDVPRPPPGRRPVPHGDAVAVASSAD